MKNSNLLLIGLNLAWAGVAAFAYFSGRWESESEAAANGGGSGTGSNRPGTTLTSLVGRGSGNPDANDGGSRSTSDALAAASSLEGILSDPDPLRRMRYLGEYLSGLGADDIAEALEIFEKAPRGGRNDEDFRNFMFAWGKIDGRAALDYALDNKDGRKVSYGASTATAAWAANDPHAAEEYVAALKPGDTKQSLHHGVVRGLAEIDLDAAAELAAENERSRARGWSLDFLARRYKEQGGIDAVRGWVDAMDESGENSMESYKLYANRLYSNMLADQDPQLAAAYLAERIDMSYVDGEMIGRVANKAFEDDPLARMDWLGNLPDGEKRGSGMAGAIDAWARTDANAAGQWLGAHEDSSEKDRMVESFSQRVSWEDPQSAVAWAAIIGDTGRRERSLSRVAWNWMRRDASSARAWVESSDLLPEETRQRLLRTGQDNSRGRD